MANFSIKQAVSFPFEMYRKHLFLLLAAGCALAGGALIMHVVPRYTANMLGIEFNHCHKTVDMESIPSDTAVNKLNTLSQRMVQHLSNTRPEHLLLLVLVYLACLLLSIFLSVGFMKLALALRDKNAANLEMLISAQSLMVPFVKMFLLFFAYAVCIFLGATLLTIPVGYLSKYLFRLTDAHILLVTHLAVFLGVMYWALGYMYSGLLLIDKKAKGARQALSLSLQAVGKNRLHIFLGLVVLMAIVFVLISLLAIPLKVVLGGMNMNDDGCLLRVLLMNVVTTPIMFLYLAGTYRDLGN